MPPAQPWSAAKEAQRAFHQRPGLCLQRETAGSSEGRGEAQDWAGDVAQKGP